ncbi:hypothetical protein HPP92_003609 [Vanilla planifolia]|uniref:VQ domain-containing protein n=1 Tax=Vanilla planifolia TaxID=51239 RepID=A0A835S2V2_VANPL|nr:hypothetical protein HPP92_003996 [Vanilla planifolia]KAG0503537.1 hypothetical protein HPP92_003609 [Vanilla planifolia]
MSSSPPAKVTFIVTKFVETDEVNFKSVVQSLTGKESTVGDGGDGWKDPPVADGGTTSRSEDDVQRAPETEFRQVSMLDLPRPPSPSLQLPPPPSPSQSLDFGGIWGDDDAPFATFL